jgi:hypothetical protein
MRIDPEERGHVITSNMALRGRQLLTLESIGKFVFMEIKTHLS